MQSVALKKTNVVYPDLSYKIVGALYDVSDELGSGHREKHYENAIAIALDERGLKYFKQLYVPLTYDGKKVGTYYFDFLIEDKIILELKQGRVFSRKNIEQISAYLKARGLKLGIIAQFTSRGVKFKRIVNLK